LLPSPSHSLSAELVAVVTAVTDGALRVLTTEGAQALPSGPFEHSHRSLQTGLRAWVEAQTRHSLGYVEQLYTFADQGRYAESGNERGKPRRTVSISYLALTRESATPHVARATWQDCYRYFPWEDQRDGVPALLTERIIPALRRWIAAGNRSRVQRTERSERAERAAVAFGLDGYGWSEDRVLQRYELLFELGLVPEAQRAASLRQPQRRQQPTIAGDAMLHDHRRILATGLARLRAKIKYRPVVFELMPTEFTLLQLQQTVEALAGRCLHKQNFRRLIEQQELVEETGSVLAGGAGRPAKLFRFRRGVLLERAIAGSKLPLARG